MATEKYILVRVFCEQTKIETEFINNLHEFGLVSFEEKENELFLDESDISEIEKLFRLHHDLGINYEGLDAIRQMLRRMEDLQNEMTVLKKKLHLYE